ncbi:MAG: hypothetical protein FJ098_11450, partial [Deltaproteobacteria bacterium]|nr:hypothetical protein [Deltaproteobacteria bacterium]
MLLSMLLGAPGACGPGGEQGSPRDPASAITAGDAEWTLVTPPIEDVRTAALRFLVNVEGLLGVVDLVQASWGVDLGDERLLENLGLDPGLPLVALGVEEGTCLVLGIRDGAPLRALLRSVAGTSGYRLEDRVADDALLTRAYDEDRCVAALLVDDGLAFVSFSGSGSADAGLARVAL